MRTARAASMLVALLGAFCRAAPAQAEPQIAWRVENPFRLFTDASDTDLHRQAFEQLDEEQRKSPVLAIERGLADLFPRGWAESVFRKLCWDPKRNQYGCSAAPDYLSPRAHRVVVELKGLETTGQRCEWRQTPLAGKRSAVPKLTTAPCADPVVLEVPYPSGIRLSVRADGPPLAEAEVAVRDIFVVGMGDSFGSGEGNPDDPVTFSRERSVEYGKGPRGMVLAGYPARIGTWQRIGDTSFVENNAKWLDQACHRSLYSHQLRVALQLAIEDPHRAVTFAGYACSGAEIIDGLFQVYRGNEWVPNPPGKSQLSAVASAQCPRGEAPQETFPATYDMGGELMQLKDLTVHRCPKAQARKIDLALISIGGNDIGFARLVANAVLSDQSMLRTLGGWMGHVHGAQQARSGLDGLALRYRALNRALHNILHIPWSEMDRVILTAYPPLAIMEDGRTVCTDDRGGMSVYPDFALIPEKAGEGETVAGELHKLMGQSASQHKWSFVERHRTAFNGRGICAGFSQDGAATGDVASLVDDLRLPLKVDGNWQPYNPADFRAYASRQRWFRTPNDAYMTGNFHMSATMANQLQKFKSLMSFQLLLASTYSGAFHPTAEGQAAMADAVLERARAVLERHKD